MKTSISRFVTWRRVACLLVAITAAALLWVFAVWPPPAWYRTHWPRETSFMEIRRAEEGGESGSLSPIPLRSVDRDLVRAVLIGEDHRFWEHGGIDFVEVRQTVGYRRPAFRWTDPADLWEMTRSVGSVALGANRGRLRGASTITQQLAKNLYLSPSRSPLRKIKEAVTALRLEHALGKERILELYLNVVELGDGVWGVEPASRRYFRRSAANLSEEEAAALAGTLPQPLTSNPAYHPRRMLWRQRLILERMRRGNLPPPPIPSVVPAEISPPGAGASPG